MQIDNTDVLIVGGGPVGLSLSIDLSWRGVRHILVEQKPHAIRTDQPRMDQVGIRTMEHIRRWGAVSIIEGAGFPRDLPRDIVFATGILGYELEREPVESDATRVPPPFSPQKHELCPQNFFDPALQSIAERSKQASLRYETKLIGFKDEGHSVSADIEGGTDGFPRRIVARYLVGCDGVNSSVAHILGASAGIPSNLACSTNIFIESSTLFERTAYQHAYRYILFDNNGVWASMANMDARNTWRLQVLGNAAWPEWTEPQARVALDCAIGTSDAPYRLKAIVPWRRQELVLDYFSKGRCFLVGDAAHQFSPTGGYGMNTGIAEAMDLSWKLAAMIEGWGGHHLLDSYTIERRPVAIRSAQRATVNFQRMLGVPGDPALFEVSPAGDAVRRRVGQAARTSMKDEWDSIGIHLGYHYAYSPIVCPDRTSEPDDDPDHYVQSARPGARAPHVWLAPERSTLDLFGRGFTLLMFKSHVDPHTILSSAAARGVPIRIERIDNAVAAKLYEHALVLVRPDGHVCWTGDTAPENALEVMDRIRGV